jgi:SAM-dependent methyltransferase
MRCGHMLNVAFEPDVVNYAEDYEISQMFSPRFRNFATTLADRLIEAFDLHDRDILEIGGGKGDFLELICERGGNRGVSIDPSYSAPARRVGESGSMEFLQEYYGEQHFDLRADFIICRHTLEHIWDVTPFVSMIRRAIGARSTPVYFEVPNAAFMMREQLISDVVYPHCSYFTSSSLLRLFSAAGFSVQYIHEAFEGQFLSVGVLPSSHRSSNRPPRHTDVPDVVMSFGKAFSQKIEDWARLLDRLESKNTRAVVWGAGAKAVTFLNMTSRSDVVPYVVDISPRKIGRHISGTGQEIVAPEFLASYQPDVVMIVNGIYEQEIRQEASALGVSPEYVLV